MSTTQLAPAEIEARALAHYRRVWGTEPVVTDYGSETSRRSQEEEIDRRMDTARREVRLRHERETALQAAQQAKRDERQAADEAALTAQLRTEFFAANASATDADFQRLLPQLRDQHMVRQMDAEAAAIAAVRAKIRL
jgi:hypothetical protein